MSRTSRLTTASAAAVVMLTMAGCASMPHAGQTTSDAGAAASAPSASAPSGAVTLPACADPAASGKMLLSTTPDGPAKDAITGNAVTTAFSLENGAFAAAPPPAGLVPAVTAEQAGCQLTSAMGVRGFGTGPGRLGLATVTIGRDVTFQDSAGVSVPVPHRSVPVYQQRVAWILVTAVNNNVSSCPSMDPAAASRQTISTPPATQPTVAETPYEIFSIDASTGADAVMFEDGTSPPCFGGPPGPPLVSVPYQILSVPWSMTSRAVDGQSAQITSAWASCEVYTGTGATYVTNIRPGRLPSPPAPVTSFTGLQAWIDSVTHLLSITVTRPFGPECGPPEQHALTVHPEKVGLAIPTTTIRAGPLGLIASEW
jgi:hypothetical protein